MAKYTETELEYFYKQAGCKPGDNVTIFGSKRLQIPPQTGEVLEVGRGWVRVVVYREAGGGKTLELPWRSVSKDDAPMPPIKGTPKVHLTDKEKLEPLQHNGKICYIIARGERPQGRINCHRFMVDVTTDTGRVIPAGTVGTYYGTQSYGSQEHAQYILEGETRMVCVPL